MGKISVVIPVMNEEEKIGQCLEAVFSQSLKPHEVIVVDGHSGDRTVEKAKEFPVRVFYEEYHTRAGACQIGVENAEGEFVAFTDADCVPEKNWLEEVVKEFDEGIVGVGCGIKNIGEGLWEKSINLISGTFLGSANSVIWLIAERRPLLYIGVPGFVSCLVGVFFGIRLLQEHNQTKFFSLAYAMLVSIFLILGALGLFMGLMLNVISRLRK